MILWNSHIVIASIDCTNKFQLSKFLIYILLLYSGHFCTANCIIDAFEKYIVFNLTVGWVRHKGLLSWMGLDSIFARCSTQPETKMFEYKNKTLIFKKIFILNGLL